jgi:hypothetical protein
VPLNYSTRLWRVLWSGKFPLKAYHKFGIVLLACFAVSLFAAGEYLRIAYDNAPAILVFASDTLFIVVVLGGTLLLIRRAVKRASHRHTRGER